MYSVKMTMYRSMQDLVCAEGTMLREYCSGRTRRVDEVFKEKYMRSYSFSSACSVYILF